MSYIAESYPCVVQGCKSKALWGEHSFCGPCFAARNPKSGDAVNHPSHYTSGKIEVKDFIRDQKLNFSRGCVVKYVSRAGKKDPNKEIEDLEKAAFYLADEIAHLKSL